MVRLSSEYNEISCASYFHVTTWSAARANEIPKSAKTTKRSDLEETLALFISFFGTVVVCEEVKRDEKISLFLCRRGHVAFCPAKRREGTTNVHIIAANIPPSLSLFLFEE